MPLKELVVVFLLFLSCRFYYDFYAIIFFYMAQSTSDFLLGFFFLVFCVFINCPNSLCIEGGQGLFEEEGKSPREQANFFVYIRFASHGEDR